MIKSKWVLSKQLLEDTLIKPSSQSKRGLLLENNEAAGVIYFEENNCRSDGTKIVCDKVYSKHTVNVGSRSEVVTPNGKVNFHTHPLHCYIDNKVIWGWPSGEDIAQCLQFAKIGNIYHIVFSIEGTYVIVVNKHLLNISNDIINKIETIFKITHEYRMYDNHAELLETFKIFLKVGNMNPPSSIKTTLDMWIYFVNHFKLSHLELYTNVKIPPEYKNLFVFKVYLFKNNSIQFKKNPIETFNSLKNIKCHNDLSKCIKVPNKIEISF